MTSKRDPSRIFYGWWVVGASLLTAFYTGGAIFYGFTAFFEPIASEFGWSYTQISFAASLRGLEIGLLSPFVGILVDRLGPRRIVFSGVLIVSIGLLLLSRASSLLTFYFAFALLAIGVSACSVTVLLTAIANWFHRRAGLAMGIASSGYGLSGLLIPVIVWLIAKSGWRSTAEVLAFGMVLLILPLSFIFRHKPEKYGYYPDGDEADVPENSNDSGSVLRLKDVKAGQAFNSPTFWRLSLARAYHMMVTAGIITHVMPYLGSVGVSRGVSSLVATAIPLMSVVGRFGFGWLADRFNRRLVAASSYVLMGGGLFFFASVSAAGMWWLIPFVFLLGIGYGGSNTALPSLGREYFGRTSLGTIYGFMEGIGTVGAVAGPALAGWAYDNWGSYQAIWWLYGGIAIVAVFAIFTATPVGSAKARE